MKTSEAVTAPPSRAEIALYRVFRFVLVGLSRLYFPGTVTGRENLPATGAFIVAPIHRSYVDWLIVARITKRRLRYIVKEEVWKSKSIGRLLEMLGAFPVNRSGADREALERCRSVLAGGEPLVMFPEGTRGSGPKVTEIRDGVAYLSLRTGVPIVPVGIGGSERAMPRGASIPRPRRVNVFIGPPLVSESRTEGAEPPDGGERAGGSASSRRARVARSATTEQSARLRAAIQGAFDAAHASVGLMSDG